MQADDVIKRQVLEIFAGQGTLVQPDAINYVLSRDAPVEFARKLVAHLRTPQLILTSADIKKFELSLKPAAPKLPVSAPVVSVYAPSPPTVMTQRKREVITAKEFAPEFKIIRDVTGNSRCEGRIKDFTKYFNSRFDTLKRILKTTRRELAGAVPISKLKRFSEQQVVFIGMVTDVKETKFGNKLIELEDQESSVVATISKNSPLITDVIMVDEVIGVLGSIKAGSELVIVDNIIRPEIPLRREPNRASEPVCAAFISDIHVGSYTFLPDAWSRFIRWLNGKNGTKMQDWLKKIKYLIISGDVVDGIGVYPGQEADLEIPDIYAQYEKLANLLQAVPDQIQIIILPGNHDAVRPSEPQPAFPSEITKLFDSNIKFVGNPCYFTIHGVEVLAYHGRSMDDFITVFPAIDISMAIPMMVEMLKRRHLAPIYGGKTPIAPEHEDYLLIDRIPDIFVTGHGHATAVDSYRNVKLINASTWQSQTAYQKMMNYKPDPAKVPIVDLQTYQHIVMEFK